MSVMLDQSTGVIVGLYLVFKKYFTLKQNDFNNTFYQGRLFLPSSVNLNISF